jgi:hypothetical protein
MTKEIDLHRKKVLYRRMGINEKRRRQGATLMNSAKIAAQLQIPAFSQCGAYAAANARERMGAAEVYGRTTWP